MFWLTWRISGVVIIITVPSTLACTLNHFNSKNTHGQPHVIYGVHLWCQGHLATHEEGDLLGSLQCFLIDAVGWPDLPPSYPPRDLAVPIPCLSFSLIWAHHRSWSHVEVVALLFCCITYDIEFLCQFKISNIENLGHSKFFLLVAFCIKFSKPISISVRFEKFVQAGCFILNALFYNVWYLQCSNNIRCGILPGKNYEVWYFE